jgi:hypothetical protein
MRFLSFVSVLLSVGASSAMPLESLVIPADQSTVPVTVALERELVDGFIAESFVIAAGDLTLSGGVNSMWHIPLVHDAPAAIMYVGYEGYGDCEIRFYDKDDGDGDISKGWEFSLPDYLLAAQIKSQNSEIRFKLNEAGAVQFTLPAQESGREIVNKQGEVIFSSKRKSYPTLWGGRYYLVEYEMTERPNTAEEREVRVSELFVNLEAKNMHLIFRAPTEYQANLYTSLFGYLKQFHIVNEL